MSDRQWLDYKDGEFIWADERPTPLWAIEDDDMLLARLDDPPTGAFDRFLTAYLLRQYAWHLDLELNVDFYGSAYGPWLPNTNLRGIQGD
jgi:hypothetical protein